MDGTGTHTGPFLLPDGSELEATGRRITLRGTCASFVEDGKVVTHREYFDQLSCTRSSECISQRTIRPPLDQLPGDSLRLGALSS